jgi:hypothetical protein
VIAFAVLTGPLPKLGVVLLAALIGGALLAPGTRTRAGAMLGALCLSPVLLLADIWRSPQLGPLHRHPLLAVVAAIVAIALLAAAAYGIHRRPAILAPLIVLALPFRVPIQAGGTTSNLLVPLYLVVAAGSLAFIVPGLRASSRQRARPGWVERLLFVYVALYAIQSIYSVDF